MRTTLLQALALTTLSGLTFLSACHETPELTEPEQTAEESRVALARSRPYLPGEEQPVVDATRNPLAIYPTGVGQNLRQTFRPSSNQRLGYLELPVACVADVLLAVKIREGFDGPVLYEVNVAGLAGPLDGRFELIQVFDPATSDGIRLRRGREYSFELAAFPAPGAAGNTCGILPGPAADSYAGGRGYYQDPINGPLFHPLPDGAPTSDEDLPFRTLVR